MSDIYSTMAERYEYVYDELYNCSIIDALWCENVDIACDLPWKTFGEMKDEGGGDVLISEPLLSLADTNYDTYREIAYCYQVVCLLPELYERAIKGDWEGLCNRVHAYPSLISDAFHVFYPDMPEEYRHDFVIGCYTHVGDNYESCRAAVRNLPRRGLVELPEEYRNASDIVVYRAGEEPPSEAPSRISWTLNEQKARWFLNKYAGRHAKYLYRARIRPRDVIAYSDDRNEQEVMQYCSVFDVEVLESL